MSRLLDRRSIRHWSPNTTGVALAVVTALAATAVAILALRFWRLDLQVPLSYSSDSLLHLGYVQNMVDTGSYLDGPRLGAPFGQQHYDYPLGPDHAHLLILRILTAVTGDAPTSVNLFYLLTFPLAALTAVWALRRLRIPPLIALFGALVFTLLPYHFLRSTGHLFLAAIYTVPVSCYLVVATIEGRRFFGLGRDHSLTTNPRRSLSQRLLDVAGPAALCLLVASGGAYYVVFTLTLLAAATVLGWLRTRSRRVLLSGSLLGALIIAFLALNSMPTFLYRLEHGMNQDVAIRDEAETERYSLRPTALVLPVVGHRLEPFAALSERYAAFPPFGERGESLGMIGAAGFVGLVLVAVGAASGAFATGRRWLRYRGLAALTAIALLIAVIGGGSTLISLLISPQIRAWARISIFIGFLAVLAVCLALGLAWRLSRRTRWRPLLAVGVVILLGLAVLDQTSDRMIPSYGSTRTEFMANEVFVQQVEGALPQGAAVYQLPHRLYPEGGVRERSVDYDPMRAYLSSRHLRWSYGGMKGREAGWQLFVQGRPPSAVLPLIAGAGFSAIWVDRVAYPDRASSTELALEARLGPPSLVSADQRYAVYDIRAFAAGTRQQLGEEGWSGLADALLTPVWVRWQSGVEPGQVDRCTISRASAGSPRLALVNDGPADRQVVVSFDLSTASGPGAQVNVRWPDGTVESFATSDAALNVRRTLTLAAGTNMIEILADAPQLAASGGDVLRLRIRDIWVLEPELLAMAGTTAPC
jgi:phosphoglycerol transferase